jgi:hypothetical protein
VNVDYYLNGTVRGIDETRKTQTFNANLSLSDAYPLNLHEQVLPIVDLMAVNNSHFKKLKEFITLQLPSGFPVKIGNLFSLLPFIWSSINYGMDLLNHGITEQNSNSEKKTFIGNLCTFSEDCLFFPGNSYRNFHIRTGNSPLRLDVFLIIFRRIQVINVKCPYFFLVFKKI